MLIMPTTTWPAANLPGDFRDTPQSNGELEDHLSEPPTAVINALAQFEGNLVILGVGGKMGPSLARMAQRALTAAGGDRKVIGVSRFSRSGVREQLENWGISTCQCDLLQPRAMDVLPDARLVVSMSGFKFGASAHPDQSWATNCLVPSHVCQRYRDSRLVAFSSGNVYGLTSFTTGGSVESDPPDPVGEYAMAVLGRERIYEFCSRQWQIPMALLRLNYATELRYGVLVDIAQAVLERQPLDLDMGYVNVLWLRDANAMALRAFEHCQSPARVINIAGREIIRVRDVAETFALRFGTSAVVTGSESDRAFLNNASAAYRLVGEPEFSTHQMIDWTAAWIARGGENSGKPTHFQVLDGKY